MYNSDTMLKEHDEIQALPRDPKDAPDVQYAVAPIRFYSDSTHLTNFDPAALYPGGM